VVSTAVNSKTNRNTNHKKEPVMAKRKSPSAAVPHFNPEVPKGPKPKFMSLGKSKYIHTIRTEVWDRKNAQCQMVRKSLVAGTINYKDKGISPEAASVLDGCPSCETAGVLKSLITPEDRRAASKARTEDTLNKVRDEQKPKSKSKRPVGPDHPKSVRKNGGGSERLGKPAAKKMVKSGPKSLGDSREKAEILKEFAEEHGWKVKVSDDKPNGIKLVSKRGNETITCWFSEGRYVTDPMGYIEVEGSSWQGKLRAAHACRRQMSGEGRDRPHPNPGSGRSAPRSKREEPTPETESPEDAHKRVPFALDDDDVVIIDAIKGKSIHWRNKMSGLVEEAIIPADLTFKKRPKVVINTHPKTGRRILSFFPVEGMGDHGEVYGGERNIALDRIIRVVG
jgi:hypothetical protein